MNEKRILTKTKRADVHDKKRQHITKSAAGLFIKKGYTNTSIRDIARTSGISIGALYHYVDSKAGILSLFIDWQSMYLNDFINNKSSVLMRKSPEESLAIGIKTYITAVDELRDVILFWYQEARNIPPDRLSCLLDIELQITQLFSDIISAGCDCGKFKVRDINLAAHNINVLGDMWAFRRWYLTQHCTLNHFIREQTRFILDGLRSGKY